MGNPVCHNLNKTDCELNAEVTLRGSCEEQLHHFTGEELQVKFLWDLAKNSLSD